MQTALDVGPGGRSAASSACTASDMRKCAAALPVELGGVVLFDRLTLHISMSLSPNGVTGRVREFCLSKLELSEKRLALICLIWAGQL